VRKGGGEGEGEAFSVKNQPIIDKF
jgi:hypothetical protein